MEFEVLISGSPSISNTFTISGENLKDAIENNFYSMVKKSNYGFIPFRYPMTVTPVFNKGLLGGKGGVELKLEWMYSSHLLKAETLHTHSVFIFANKTDIADMETFVVEEDKPVWGGKREGAGRPSTGRKKHQVYVTGEEFEQVKSLIDKLRQEKG